MIKPLLPKRHPKDDWFICDFSDAIPKSDIASMEHPLFTLTTRRDTTIKTYEYNDIKITFTPSVLGHATIYDKDIIIYCVSQLMAGINKGYSPSRTVKLKAYDLLMTTNRGTGGREYKLLRQAFARLAGTLIETNIKTNGKKITKGFGIIDSYEIIIDNPKTKRMVELEITLSEWIYNSILGKQILTIHPDYFRIRKPIDRRLYEIARKHCGQNKKGWEIGIKKLHKKVGAISPINKFKKSIHFIMENQHLPDYNIGIIGNNVMFRYTNKISITPSNTAETDLQLKPQTIENAKKILNGQHDVYGIEQEWRDWAKDKEKPKSPDGAFVNFCKKKVGQI